MTKDVATDIEAQTKVAPGCCCFIIIKSTDRQKKSIQSITFIWNAFNNTLLYFNTMDKAFNRLGLSAHKLSSMSSLGEGAGFVISSTFLISFFVGNQRKYGHDALVAIYPEHPDKLTSHWAWTANDLCNAITKTYCNTLTAMETFQQPFGWPGALVAGVGSAWFNYEANSAYYLRSTQSKLAHCLPDWGKKTVRYIVVSGFSLSSALFYTMSLAFFRGHLDKSEKSCFDNPDGWDYLTMLGCLFSLVTITPATFARYNNAMAKRLGDADCELPNWLKKLCESDAISYSAAACKTSIALTSTLAFLSDYFSSAVLKGLLCSAGWAAGGVVQYGMFGKRKSSTNAVLEHLVRCEGDGDEKLVDPDAEPQPAYQTMASVDKVSPVPTDTRRVSRRGRSNCVVQFFRWFCSGYRSSESSFSDDEPLVASAVSS